MAGTSKRGNESAGRWRALVKAVMNLRGRWQALVNAVMNPRIGGGH